MHCVPYQLTGRRADGAARVAARLFGGGRERSVRLRRRPAQGKKRVQIRAREPLFFAARFGKFL